MTIRLALVLCVIVTTSASGVSQCPTDSRGLLYRPYGWADLGGAAQAYTNALNDEGYNVTPLICDTDPLDFHGEIPQTNVLAFVEQLEEGFGCWFQVTHGDADGCAVEAYPHTPAGLTARESQLDAYQLLNSDLDLYPGETDDGFDIRISIGEVADHYVAANSIVFNAACEGQAYEEGAWPEARVRIGYIGCPYLLVADAEAIEFWNRMGGSGGVSERNCTGAKNSWTFGFDLDGNGDTVLSPAVLSCNIERAQNIPEWPTALDIRFDAEVSTSVDALEAIGVVGSTIQMAGEAWSGSDGLVATLEGVSEEYGSSEIIVRSGSVLSAQNDELALDGDGSGGPSDWRRKVNHGNNPAATIEVAAWTEGDVRWLVSSEYGTIGYLIEGRTSPDTTWSRTGELVEPGVGWRSMSVGDALSEVRLSEVESGGRTRMIDLLRPDTLLRVQEDVPMTLSELEDSARVAMERQGDQDASGSLSGKKLAMFAPYAWASPLRNLSVYLEDTYGIVVSRNYVDQFGASASARYAGIRALVRNLYLDGYEYVLLVGDASDWEYFDGQYTTEYWPTCWQNIRQGYFSSGYPEGGNPDLNIIPVVMEKDPLPRGQNTANLQPYYQVSDMLTYGDVDDDGLPDVTVGRWPVADEVELLTMINNLIEYLWNGGTNYNLPYTVCSYIGDVNHNAAGAGAEAIGVADAIKGNFSPGTVFYDIYETDHPIVSERTEAAVDLWNAEQPEVVLMAAAASGRYNPGWFFPLASGFSMDMIQQPSFTPLVIGTTCATADEYRTEHPDGGENVAHRMLTSFRRGAIGWIGPSAGTYQNGNRIIGEEVVEELQADPARPAAESLRLALRTALCDSATANENALATVRSYQFLGFPLTPLEHRKLDTAMADGRAESLTLSMRPVAPNPSGDAAMIRFCVPKRSRVSVRLIDVTGRMVAELAEGNFEAGPHLVNWKMDKSLAQGVYFVRLEASGRVLTRKCEVLR